uniref:Uncharacterized protein n=1 Tax=Lates calcarifer TaxID=8187 RepID=A0A4W6D9E8_LATCA
MVRRYRRSHDTSKEEAVTILNALWQTCIERLMEKRSVEAGVSAADQSRGRCMKSACTNGIQEENHYSQNFAKEHEKKPNEYWQHTVWPDETKIYLFGSDGVQNVWCGPETFMDGTMNSSLYTHILNEKMTPSLKRLGRRGTFWHGNDSKYTAKITMLLWLKRRTLEAALCQKRHKKLRLSQCVDV